jgi:hypothetical protein
MNVMSILDQTKYAALGLALALSSAPLAQAATLLGSYQHDYGSLPGRIDPTGNDLLNPASVTVSDQSTERFADQFDFSSLVYESITSFVLTLTYAGAGPSFSYQCLPVIGCALVPNEFWTARVQGTDAAAAEDDYYGALSEGPVQTLTLTAADDTGGVSAFAQALASKSYAFWMSEWSAGADEMTLTSAKLEIFGTPVSPPPGPSPVPLPASGLLLVGALGGMALLRRRARA